MSNASAILNMMDFDEEFRFLSCRGSLPSTSDVTIPHDGGINRYSQLYFLLFHIPMLLPWSSRRVCSHLDREQQMYIMMCFLVSFLFVCHGT